MPELQKEKKKAEGEGVLTGMLSLNEMLLSAIIF